MNQLTFRRFFYHIENPLVNQTRHAEVRSLPFLAVMIFVAALTASAQSFRAQCPPSTITHPAAANNNSEPAYNGPTVFGTAPVVGTAGGYVTPTANINGAIECQQISGGDGYMTEADGTQTFMFSFGPLSGLADLAAGRALSFRMSSTPPIPARWCVATRLRPMGP